MGIGLITTVSPDAEIRVPDTIFCANTGVWTNNNVEINPYLNNLSINGPSNKQIAINLSVKIYKINYTFAFLNNTKYKFWQGY